MIMNLNNITSLRNLFKIDEPMIIEDLPTTSGDPGISGVQLIATTSMSSVNQTVTYANKEEINEILKNANIRRLNELFPRHYNDICVQAIALFIGDRNNVILRCWDTTSPPKYFHYFMNFIQKYKNFLDIKCIMCINDIAFAR
ncbi:unnamed protein product [Onchocerca flexuosa]|uniref:POT1PC domain-containing protein n=1 Tax=Onchocerca flexuosa TaxID=387005 RepID=A0A183HT73_9BILA|nr:unnamed protein product [Onchocerca flexuosa]